MTSIEWLIDQLVKMDKQLDGRRKNEDATILKTNPTKLFEQAKEMHKQEQEKLVDDALINYGIGYSSPKVENKTSFGEISDEEIWEASINYDNGATYETPIVHFQQGAFWYREQLKNR